MLNITQRGETWIFRRALRALWYSQDGFVIPEGRGRLAPSELGTAGMLRCILDGFQPGQKRARKVPTWGNPLILSTRNTCDMYRFTVTLRLSQRLVALASVALSNSGILSTTLSYFSSGFWRSVCGWRFTFIRGNNYSNYTNTLLSKAVLSRK